MEIITTILFFLITSENISAQQLNKLLPFLVMSLYTTYYFISI